jgi:uncharacterized protein
MSSGYLVVDGHSVIYAWPELRSLHERQPRQAREALLTRLRHLHETSTWAVTLIFDGRYGASPLPDRTGFIVRYSTAVQSADSLIEALVAAQKDRSRITVITADQAERHCVESLGAFCHSPGWLLGEIGAQAEQFAVTHQRVKRQARW